ncbi:MAG: anti-sigma factor family protein [Terriglobales bacterium]
MKCSEFVQEMEAVLDPTTVATLRAELESHLGKCGNCRVVVDTCRKTISFYRDEELQPVPAGLRGRIIEALAEAHRRKP